MPFSVLASQLGPICVSSAKLQAFSLRQTQELLIKLGRVEYSAAMRSLNEAAISRAPELEIQSARTQLRSAFARFDHCCDIDSYSAKLRDWLAYCVTLGCFPTPGERAAVGAVECATMLAVLYSCEDNVLVRDKWIASARSSIGTWDLLYVWRRSNGPTPVATDMNRPIMQRHADKIKKPVIEILDNLAAL